MTTRSLPTVDIKLDGRKLAEKMMAHLTRCIVRQALSRPTLCELEFHERTDLIETFDHATSLTLGVNGALLFSGDITAVSTQYETDGWNRLAVRAFDRLHRLRTAHHIRQLDNQTASELARTLCIAVGLEVVAVEDSPRQRRIGQGSQTDLELLLEILTPHGLHTTVEGKHSLPSLAERNRPRGGSLARGQLAGRAPHTAASGLDGGNEQRLESYRSEADNRSIQRAGRPKHE